MNIKQTIKNIITNQNIKETCLHLYKEEVANWNPDYVGTLAESLQLSKEDVARYEKNNEEIIKDCVEEFILEYLTPSPDIKSYRSDHEIKDILKKIPGLDEKYIRDIIDEMIHYGFVKKCCSDTIELTSFEEKRQRAIKKIQSYSSIELSKFLGE